MERRGLGKKRERKEGRDWRGINWEENEEEKERERERERVGGGERSVEGLRHKVRDRNEGKQAKRRRKMVFESNNPIGYY